MVKRGTKQRDTLAASSGLTVVGWLIIVFCEKNRKSSVYIPSLFPTFFFSFGEGQLNQAASVICFKELSSDAILMQLCG